jgi:hypothetical protein
LYAVSSFERAGVLPDWVHDVGVIVLIVVSLFSAMRVLFWPCPRCGNAFHFRAGWKSYFASRCLHCSLPRNALPGEGERDAR